MLITNIEMWEIIVLADDLQLTIDDVLHAIQSHPRKSPGLLCLLERSEGTFFKRSTCLIF